MDRLGFEPRASCLQSRRSSADLPAHSRVLSVAPRMKLSALVGPFLRRWRSICSLTSCPPTRVSPIKTFSFSGLIRTEWKASLPPPFMTIIRGVATSRGIAATSAAVLTFLLLVTVIPAVTFLPSAAVVATGGEHGPPTSTAAPLPAYTTSQVVTISYAVFCLKKKRTPAFCQGKL